MQKLPPGRAVSIKGNKALGEKIVAIARHPIDVKSRDFERMLREVLFEDRAPAANRAGRRPAGATAGRRTAAR